MVSKTLSRSNQVLCVSFFLIGSLVAALFGLGPVARAQTPEAQSLRPLPSSVMTHNLRPEMASGQISQIKRMGHLSAAKNLRLSLVLPHRNQPQLDQLLKDLYDPSSPKYRHFLSVEQFTAQFGPTQKDYDTLKQFATANGLKVVGESRNRMNLDIEGSVTAVEQALKVKMGVYQHPAEARTFFSADREPSLNLPFRLWHIAGLDNYSMPHTNLIRKSSEEKANVTVSGSAPGGQYLGSDMRAAYYGQGPLTGTGQSVALLEFSGIHLPDVAQYFTNAGQTNNVPISVIPVDGSAADCTSCYGEDEAVLDVTQAIGMAPGLSSVVMYTAATANKDVAMFNAMATASPLSAQIGISWSWSTADRAQNDVYFQEFAAQGQNVFVAAGDSGSWVSGSYEYPADDPYLTSVGGTSLQVASAGGAWASETAWEDSGGGITTNGFAIPTWQQLTLSNCSSCSTTLRNGPDVSANADFNFYVCATAAGGCATGYGGTSFAAPMWAGYMALINQQSVANGQGLVGFVNPALYGFGQGPDYSSYFHDITSGNNGFSAGPGYDLVTGWGSPNGNALITGLANGPVAGPTGFYLTSSPAAVTVVPGSTVSAGTTILSNAASGFASGIQLSLSGLPAGVSYTFGSSSISAGASTSLTFTAGPQAVPGAYTILVNGTGGGQSANTAITLTVQAGFSLSATPANLIVLPGSAGSATITSTIISGFNQPVTLAATGQPAGMTIGFIPAAISGTGNSAVTIAVAGSVNPGIYPIAVTGTWNSSVVTTSFTVAVNLGATANVCAAGQSAPAPCSQNIVVTFPISSTETIAAVKVLTQGAANLDFTLGSGGTTCQGTLTAPTSCTVHVNFAPLAAGSRLGAVELTDSSGNVLATQYIQGMGQGSVTAFPPAAQTNFAGGVYGRMVFDASGNLYIPDPPNQQIDKITPQGQRSVVGTGFDDPYSLAVDGAGYLYVANYSGGLIKIAPNGATTRISGGFNYATGVAVDGAGNIYVSDALSGLVKIQYGTGISTTLVTGGYPDAVKVDGFGNIFYIASGQLKKISASGVKSSIPVSGLRSAEDLALDAAGDIFLADFNNAQVIELFAGGGTTVLPFTGLSRPGSVAVDGAGNVFESDAYTPGILELKRAQPSALSFAATITGSTSTDSAQTVAVQNIGNAPLSFSAVSYPVDFPEAPGVATDCSPSSAVSAGAFCTLSINFTPTTGGVAPGTPLSETVSLSSNATNAPNGTQTVPVQGAAIGVAQVSINPPSVDFGNVTVNGNAVQQVTLTNTGLGSLTITGVGGSGNFLSLGDCVFRSTIAPGASCYQSISFSPTTAGPVTGTLTFTDNNGGVAGSTQTVTLSATAVNPLLTVTAGPGGTLTANNAANGYYAPNSVETLSAAPSLGYYFSGWTGGGGFDIASRSSATTTITVRGNETVTANFTPVPSFVVTTTADDASGVAGNCPGSNCSLRDALAASATTGGNITFDPSVFATAQIIALSNTLNIPSNTIITGATSGSGASLTNLVTVSGNNAVQVFNVASGVTGAAINNLVITGGSVLSPNSSNAIVGGGISNAGVLNVTSSTISGNTLIANITHEEPLGGGIYNTGTLAIANSTIANNAISGFRAEGAGVYSSGTLTILDSTISGNVATGTGTSPNANGGGIYTYNGSMSLTGVTLSNNSVVASGAGSSLMGGGIFAGPGTQTLSNTIVSGNVGGDVNSSSGTFTADASNQIGAANINLAPLGNYGGPTQTMLPLPGSPAICGGLFTDMNGTIADQRGNQINPQCPSSSVDAGAVETNYALSFTTNPPSNVTAGIVISPAPTVTLTESGAAANAASNSIKMTDTASLLSGTTSTNLANGTASFNNLIFSYSTNSDFLKATLALSASINLTANSTPLNAIGSNGTKPQTITIPVIPTQLIGVAYTLNATSTSGLPITFSSSTGSICTSNSGAGTITGIAAGLCTVTAYQAGNSTFKATSARRSFNVVLVSQTITIPVIPTQLIGAAYTLSATSNSGLAITYSSSSGSICTLNSSAGTITGISAGVCTITAIQAGNSMYKAATVSRSFNVVLLSQTVNFPVVPTERVGIAYPLNATSNAGLPITYTSSTSSICTLNSGAGTITGIAAGVCTVSAKQAGNSTYKPATLARSFNVVPLAQTITFPAVPSQPVGTTYALNATSDSGLAITFSSSTGSICILNSSAGTITGIAAGVCTVTAKQAGSATYYAATLSRSFYVLAATQTITFPVISTQLIGTAYTLNATSDSGLPITYTSTTLSVCTLNSSAGTITGIAAGICTVTANQTGNSTHKAATLTRSFNAVPVSQTITFTPATIPNQTVGTSLTLLANASSGLAVAFSSSTQTVCSVSDTTATFLNAGTCAITATQAGNTMYKSAAASVHFSVVATK